MRTHKLFTIVVILIAACLLCTGCQSLRFAPTEAQKETAELTDGLAGKINTGGTAPGSEASEKLCDGTRAAALYMGRPKVPADPDRFDTVVARANVDAAARPSANDVFDAADKGLSLAAELAILFGVGGAGVAGKKLIDWVALARTKGKALSEIIRGNELLKEYLEINNKPAEIEAFKEFQSQVQNGKTPELVAAMRVPIKRKTIMVPAAAEPEIKNS